MNTFLDENIFFFQVMMGVQRVHVTTVSVVVHHDCNIEGATMIREKKL